jgi:hypothetical protein
LLISTRKNICNDSSFSVQGTQGAEVLSRLALGTYWMISEMLTPLNTSAPSAPQSEGAQVLS